MLRGRVKFLIQLKRNKVNRNCTRAIKISRNNRQVGKDLTSIAKNKMDPNRFMVNIKDYVKYIVDESKKVI